MPNVQSCCQLGACYRLEAASHTVADEQLLRSKADSEDEGRRRS